MQRHAEISFLIFRNYEHADEQPSTRYAAAGTKDRASNDDEVASVWSSESISIISDRLYQACQKSFKALPYSPVGPKADLPRELNAPYLSIYHSRQALEACTLQLDSQDLEEWNLLIGYVLEAYGGEYERADALISQKIISNAYMKYLFKPDEYVVDVRAGVEPGYMSTSWPKLESMSK